MPRFLAILRSTAGLKALAAVSGSLVAIWVLLHLAGNLTLFGRAGAADEYAALLRETPTLLWTARVGLLGAFLAHVYATTVLQARARRARPVAHAPRAHRAATWASRTMRITGPLLAVFIVLHVLHLTLGVGVIGFVPLRVHDNVLRGLSSLFVAGAYTAAAVLLGLHVLHGLWSAPRSLGASLRSASRLRRPLVSVVAILVACGFASVPVLASLGMLR